MLEIVLFYIAATVALVATVMAMTRANAIHALIYLIVSLLAVAVIFFLIGAPGPPLASMAAARSFLAASWRASAPATSASQSRTFPML